MLLLFGTSYTTELRPDGQLTDVLMSQLLREPFKHIGLLCCALPHTV